MSAGVQSTKKTRDLILISIFAALVAVGAFIRIPLPFSPVPVTLQFIFSAYAGLFLGPRKGAYALLVYIGLGLIGLPVFTQGGGIGYIFMPTFGFLIGFTLSTVWIGYCRTKMKEYKFLPLFCSIAGGLVILYLCGWLYLHWVLAIYGGKAMTLTQSFMVSVAPFVVSDLIFAAVAALTAVRVLPILKRLGYL